MKHEPVDRVQVIMIKGQSDCNANLNTAKFAIVNEKKQNKGASIRHGRFHILVRN